MQFMLIFADKYFHANDMTCFMLQFIRFLRRTEGVEAARKYFLDARKSPTCTSHVYVAYASVAFCLDKDPKVLLFPSLVHVHIF
jgi:hypothetical protein